MRRTKIVCTLGPSTETPERIRTLVSAGMDVARLNFSHGSHSAHARMYEAVRDAAGALNRNVAILADLQGPKMRTGRLEGGRSVQLNEGAKLVITTEDILGTAERIATTYPDLPRDVQSGDRILLADGAMELVVEDTSETEVHCRVNHGGVLGERKGINLPGVAVSAPSLTEKDREDAHFVAELGVDYIALSFVRSPKDLIALRDVVADAHPEVRLIAKIERPEAVECFDAIMDHSDGIMMARGDLGIEIPLEDVPHVQKRCIRACNERGIPVITATQMLESMISNPRPTRAETADVANAIYDGTDAVMLSGETAIGAFPVETVSTMARIAEKADDAIALKGVDCHPSGFNGSFGDAIGCAVRQICIGLSIRRIVCFTSSGYTALAIARRRPPIPITAFTLTESARRRCALYWGVCAEQQVEAADLDEMVAVLERHLLENELAEMGDAVIMVAGTPLAVAGRTNLLKIHQVGCEAPEPGLEESSNTVHDATSLPEHIPAEPNTPARKPWYKRLLRGSAPDNA